MRRQCRGYTPRYDPAGLGDSPETWLELGDSLAIRPNMAVHRVTRLDIVIHWRPGGLIRRTTRPKAQQAGLYFGGPV